MNDIFENTETMKENEHPRFYTAESVMRGHPDKLCDLIADSVLDACLQHDPASRVACEVMATHGHIIVQLAIVDTGTAELIDTVQQERGETAPETERVQTEDGAVDFEVGADEEQFNMVFPQGSENASPSEPFSDSSRFFANSPSPRADQLRAKGERPSVRMELQDITAYLRNRAEAPKDRMPKMPVKIKRKEKTL